MIPLQMMTGDKRAGVSDVLPIPRGEMKGSLFIACRAGNSFHIVGKVFQGIVKVVGHSYLAAGASGFAQSFRSNWSRYERYRPAIFCGDDDRLASMRIGKQLVQAILSVFYRVGFHLSFPNRAFIDSVAVSIG